MNEWDRRKGEMLGVLQREAQAAAARRRMLRRVSETGATLAVLALLAVAFFPVRPAPSVPEVAGSPAAHGVEALVVRHTVDIATIAASDQELEDALDAADADFGVLWIDGRVTVLGRPGGL